MRSLSGLYKPCPHRSYYACLCASYIVGLLCGSAPYSNSLAPATLRLQWVKLTVLYYVRLLYRCSASGRVAMCDSASVLDCNRPVVHLYTWIRSKFLLGPAIVAYGRDCRRRAFWSVHRIPPELIRYMGRHHALAGSPSVCRRIGVRSRWTGSEPSTISRHS